MVLTIGGQRARLEEVVRGALDCIAGMVPTSLPGQERLAQCLT